MRVKKRLAFIGVGMIGAGSLGQGIPAFAEAIKILANHYDVTVYSFIPLDKTKVPRSISVRYVPFKNMPQRLQYLYLGLLFVFDHIHKKYEIIHAQSPFPAGLLSSFLNKLLKIPWLLTIHAGEVAHLPEVAFGDLCNRHLKRAAIKCCKEATLLSAVSRWQANDAVKNLGIDREIIILTRGANVFPLKEKNISFPMRFLHVSNYQPIKDYDTLIKSFRLLEMKIPCELTIVGAGYDKEFISRYDTIKFVGAVNHLQMKELYAGTHILLHTSRFEGLPMVALEAMAHGVVVCGTHVGIMADLSGKYCLTVPPGSYTMLANEVIKLIQDTPRYQEMREQAHDWVNHHDLTWHINELKDVYSKLTAP
jgi:glycosyltransferase involved in cell wall biosynthesis